MLTLIWHGWKWDYGGTITVCLTRLTVLCHNCHHFPCFLKDILMFHCTDNNAQSFIFICHIKYSVYSYGLWKLKAWCGKNMEMLTVKHWKLQWNLKFFCSWSKPWYDPLPFTPDGHFYVKWNFLLAFSLLRWHSFFFPSDWPTAKIMFCIHRICEDMLEQPNIFNVEEQGGTLNEVIQMCACSTYGIPAPPCRAQEKPRRPTGSLIPASVSSWGPTQPVYIHSMSVIFPQCTRTNAQIHLSLSQT